MTGSIHREIFLITVPTYTMEPRINGAGVVTGHYKTRTGHRSARIAVEIDIAGLAEDLGPRAARASRHRATGLNKRVIVREIR